MKTMYTKDGRKVRVIQEINPGFVIQEIFVDKKGNELLGEHPFVVQELFFEPPEQPLSWKEKQLKEKELALERKEKYLNKKQDELYDIEDHLLRRIKSLKHFDKVTQEDSLQNLYDFICGRITWYFVYSTYNFNIISFEDATSENYYRLLSLFGDSEKNLTWCLSIYSDDSGVSYRDYVKPCLSYMEAIEAAQKWLDNHLKENKLEDSVYNTAKKFDLILPKDRVLEYFEAKKEAKRKDLERYIKSISDIGCELKEIENGIKEFE